MEGCSQCLWNGTKPAVALPLLQPKACPLDSCLCGTRPDGPPPLAATPCRVPASGGGDRKRELPQSPSASLPFYPGKPCQALRPAGGREPGPEPLSHLRGCQRPQQHQRGKLRRCLGVQTQEAGAGDSRAGETAGRRAREARLWGTDGSLGAQCGCCPLLPARQSFSLGRAGEGNAGALAGSPW